MIAGSEITINVSSSDYTYIILYSLLLHKWNTFPRIIF
uniref:Uncharacterized protein n=1 Tax=Myoviridae sp. ctZgq1 TaxID=2826666 RepID=A0A8S5LXS5_9CAUD|nr:MAG TPA: hypothetical protein [Myoviridae sp. ctZgq1]